MAQTLKKVFSNQHILAVILISLTAVITHGLIIPRLGFYYDDWYMLWSGASRGPGLFVSLFSVDRPFIGVIYAIFYRLIGQNIAGWHLFTLLFRIAGGLAFYWILNLVWPRLKIWLVLTAMLFVVFPGFLAEPNAATKINHLISYAAVLFSIAFSLKAVKTERRAWKLAWFGLSLLFMALYLWLYEYMIGLEVMRIALLFRLGWPGGREKIAAAARKVALTYSPYVLMGMLFVFWRLFIFKSLRPATNIRVLGMSYLTDPLNMGLQLIFQTVKDFFSAALFAWGVEAYHLFASADFRAIALALLAAAVVVLLAVLTLRAARQFEPVEEELDAPLSLVAIGALITLAAVFPVVITDHYLNLMDPYKSYALHPSAGVLIMVLGLAMMLKAHYRRAWFASLLAVSVAAQLLNGQVWANLWDVQKNFWWQLTWRAPNLVTNTLVMAYAPDGYAFQQDYEVWGPLNLIYRPEKEPYPLIQSEVLNADTAQEVFAGTFTEPHDRDIYVPRYFGNLLLVSQPTLNSCIHVIDGKLPVYSTSERLIVEKVGAYSNLEFVNPTGAPATPPEAIFGKEPPHGWCYTYQQAELARQVGNWQKIGELYDQAQSAHLKAGDASEYFVFIEGLVNQGRAAEAAALFKQQIQPNPDLAFTLCKSISSAPAYPAEFGYKTGQIKQLLCK